MPENDRCLMQPSGSGVYVKRRVEEGEDNGGTSGI